MKTLLLILFSTLSYLLFANTYAGGNITYKPTGITNEFEFTVNLFVNCGSTVPPGASIQLNIKNACNAIDTSIAVGYVSHSEISQICTTSLSNTSCSVNTSGALQGRHHYIYKGTFQLMTNCNEWTVSISECNRSTSVNNFGGCLYVETKLDNLNFACNSSPFIGHKFQVPYVCVGQNVTLNVNAIDPDGDSLVYHVRPGFTGPGTPVTHIPPANSINPIAGLILDSLGELSFSLPALGNYNITILIEEYSSQGQLKGSVLHDFQIVSLACTNSEPIYLGAFNFDAIGTNATLSGDTLYLDPSDEFCFEVHFSDTDPNATLENFTNVTDILPNAVVTSIPGNPAVIKICWDFDQNYVGTTFSVETSNNTCPVPGITSKFFHLALPNSINTIPDTIPQCDVPALAIDFGCSGPDLLGWNDINGDPLDVGIDISCNPCNNPDFLFVTDTTISVYNFAFPSIEQNIFIDFINVNANVLDDSTFICLGDSITFSGPHPNFTEVWTIEITDFIQNALTIDTLTQPLKLNYSMNAQNYCFLSDSTVIIPKKPLVIISDVGSQLLCNMHTSYQWLLNNVPISGETSQLHFPVSNGDYSVIGYNIWNCSDTSDVITITSAGLSDNAYHISFIRNDDLLTIQGLPTQSQIQIFDLQGKIVTEKTISNSQNLFKLPTTHQIYITRVMSLNGEIIAIRKL